MKKIFLIFVFLLLLHKISYATISVDAFLTADDVTVTHLENQRTTFQGAINSADGSLIQAGTITSSKLDANANPENRWNEAFNDFIYTGLLPPTSTSLTSITTSGTAYINGVRVVKDATSKTYTASKQTFVDLSSTGTYTYSEITIGGSEPAVATDSIRLVRVSTDTTKVLEIRDDRITSIIASGSRYKVGSFARDMTGVNAVISYTGIGFKPVSIIVFGVNTGSGINGSWGMGDANSSRAIYNESGTTAVVTDAVLINIQTTTGRQSAVISSFDFDGFTLSWTKSSSPTGTATMSYIAFR